MKAKLNIIKHKKHKQKTPNKPTTQMLSIKVVPAMDYLKPSNSFLFRNKQLLFGRIFQVKFLTAATGLFLTYGNANIEYQIETFVTFATS